MSEDDAGRPAFRAESRCAASALLIPLPGDFDLARTPRLAWRWRVEEAQTKDTSERERAGDDFAARVYVLFRFDAERATRWQRFEHGVGKRLFGHEMPGETLNYVWADREPVGAAWPSAVRAEAQLVVAQSDASSPASRLWRETIVDVAADAARHFPEAPREQPYAVGIMSDTDDTCGTAVAGFADFRWLGPTPKEDPNLAP